MVKHSAKRVGPSCYTYRGYVIEEVNQFNGHVDVGYGRFCWNITPEGEHEAHESTTTLKDAKACVDSWLAA